MLPGYIECMEMKWSCHFPICQFISTEFEKKGGVKTVNIIDIKCWTRVRIQSQHTYAHLCEFIERRRAKYINDLIRVDVNRCCLGLLIISHDITSTLLPKFSFIFILKISFFYRSIASSTSLIYSFGKITHTNMKTNDHTCAHTHSNTHTYTHERNTQAYLFAHETIFRVFNEMISVKRHSEKCLMGRKKVIAITLSALSRCEYVCICLRWIFVWSYMYIHKCVCVCRVWACVCWLQMYTCACVLNYIMRPNVAHTLRRT